MSSERFNQQPLAIMLLYSCSDGGSSGKRLAVGQISSIIILSLFSCIINVSNILFFKIRQKILAAKASYMFGKFFPTCILSGFGSTVINTSLVHAVLPSRIHIRGRDVAALMFN